MDAMAKQRIRYWREAQGMSKETLPYFDYIPRVTTEVDKRKAVRIAVWLGTCLSQVKAPEINEKFGLKKFQLSDLLRYMNALDYPIISGQAGYWWARNSDEWEAYVKNMDARAYSILKSRRDRKRVLNHFLNKEKPTTPPIYDKQGQGELPLGGRV